ELSIVAVSSPPFDHYAVLQVHPGADREVVEAAYRQLMKKYHPDVAGADAQDIAEHHRRAKAINQAYAVLRDPAQRRSYDAQRASFVNAPTTPGWSSRPRQPDQSPPPSTP